MSVDINSGKVPILTENISYDPVDIDSPRKRSFASVAVLNLITVIRILIKP